MTQSPFMAAAQAAADAAEAVIRHYYRPASRSRSRPMLRPSPAPTSRASRPFAPSSASAFPDHGFYGEETGQSDIDAEHVWLIDPIDGTKSFVRRYPFFNPDRADVQG
jgi:histidinol-phosphatase